MPFSPPPDMLYQTVHPVTGITTTWTSMVGSDLSFARASASYSVFSGDGGINPFGSAAAPLKIRTFKFDFIHAYQAGETYTQWRDKLMQACMHGREMQFFVKCGDGSLRMGVGNCNVSDMRETRDAMVLFKATIEFECVNPYLRDQYETGTLRWDNALTWDVGHDIYTLTASAPLTGGTYQIHQGANATAATAYNAPASTLYANLGAATPAPISYYASSGALEQGPFVQATPLPATISATAPGVRTALTLTTSGITGGTLTLAQVQSGSAAAPNTWDFSPNLFTLNSPTGGTSHLITSNGNASDRELVINVYGPISPNYFIYNRSIPGPQSGYMAFGMAEGLNAGESHQFDIAKQSVRKIVGANSFSSWAFFYWPPGQDELFRIDPGVNDILVVQTLPYQVTAQCKFSTKGHYL